MNTKTTKFLAVLAILAMAFAIVVVSDQNDADDVTYVAEVTIDGETTQYETVSAALTAAAVTVEGETTYYDVKLLADYVEPTRSIINSHIDLNGYTWYISKDRSGDQKISYLYGGMSNGTFTYEDGSTTRWNNVQATNPTFENVIFKCGVVGSVSGGTFIDCTFESYDTVYSGLYLNNNTNNVYIEGCTFNGSRSSGDISFQWDKESGQTLGTVTVKDCGEVTMGFAMADLSDIAKITIEDTTVTTMTVEGYNGSATAITMTADATLFAETTIVKKINWSNELDVPEGMTLTVPEGTVLDLSEGALTVEGTLSLTGGEIELADAMTITFPDESVINGCISFTDDDGNTNAVAGTFVVSGDDGLSITAGSLTINGSVVAGDESTEDYTITFSGSEIYLSGTFTDVEIVLDDDTVVTLSDDVTLDGTTTMTIGSASAVNVGTNTLTVNTNAVLIIEGTVTSDDTGSIQNDGTIEVSDDAAVDVEIEGEGEIIPIDSDDEFGIEGTLDTDYTITTSAYLAGDLTIPEGITLYVNGTLKMLSKDLYVKGNLVVGSKGIITTTLTDAEIFLYDTGYITNNGVIGSGSVATITAATEKTTAEAAYGTVQAMDVKGVEFSITKTVSSGKVYYILAVSGEVSSVKGGDPYLAAVQVYIGDLNLKDITESYIYRGLVAKGSTFTIGAKTIADAGSLVGLESGAVMQINGYFADSYIYLTNGATVNVAGDASGTLIGGKTGEYDTYTGDSKTDPEDALNVISYIETDDVKGYTVTVTSLTYLGDDGEYKTEQMMNVSGSVALKTGETVGTITICGYDEDSEEDVAGTVYVSGELTLAKGVALISSNDSVIVTTGLLTIYDYDIDFFVGAEYAIEYDASTSDAYFLYYYTTFDDAYPYLASSYNQTITLQGGYEFDSEYVILDDQMVYFIDEKDYVISIDGKLTVKDGAIVSDGFTDIQGILYVEIGGYCVPDEGSYTVCSKDDDGNMTYTGLARALADADAGDVITLYNDVTLNTLLTIPSGVTLVVSESVTLDADKGLTVNGILENLGIITVDGGKLIVAGVLNNDSTTNVVVTGYASDITGLFYGGLTSETGINAAYFNNGEENIYTTPAVAATLVSLMDVPAEITVVGTVTDSNDVVLYEDMIMTINGTVKVPSITVNAGAKLNMGTSGVLTTTIYGDIGDLVSTVPAVSVTSLTAAAGTIFKTVYSEAYETYTSTLSTYASGTAVIDAGSVTFTGTTMEFASTLVLKVSSGAEMITTSAVTFSGNSSYFTMSGFWDMQAGGSISGLKLAGTTEVAAGTSITLEAATITGTVILDEATSTAEAATATVTTSLIMGTAAKTLGADASFAGAISLGSAYVIAYGSSYFGPEDEDIVNTAFYVNDVLYATVYGASTTDLTAITTINTAVKKLADAGYDIPSSITWKSGSSTVSTSTKIGAYASASLTLEYTAVSLTYSVAPGIYLYVDGVDVTSGSDTLSVGTHTVATYVAAGYQGDITVTLNGTVLPVTASGITLNITPAMQSTTNVLAATGAEPIPEPEPVTPEEQSEWTITTILLVILVILIAIMAVIVALRLNRN